MPLELVESLQWDLINTQIQTIHTQQENLRLQFDASNAQIRAKIAQRQAYIAKLETSHPDLMYQPQTGAFVPRQLKPEPTPDPAPATPEAQ